MTVTVDIVPEDYRWYYRYVLHHFHKFRWILLVAYLVTSTLNQLNAPPEVSPAWRATDQLVMTLIYAFLWWLTPKLLDRLYRRFKLPLGEHSFAITSDYFRGSNQYGSFQVVPGAIREARETDRYFLIVFHNATAAILPKRELSDPAAFRTALDELKIVWKK